MRKINSYCLSGGVQKCSCSIWMCVSQTNLCTYHFPQTRENISCTFRCNKIENEIQLLFECPTYTPPRSRYNVPDSIHENDHQNYFVRTKNVTIFFLPFYTFKLRLPKTSMAALSWSLVHLMFIMHKHLMCFMSEMISVFICYSLFRAWFVPLSVVVPEWVELEGQGASCSPFGVSVKHRRECSNSCESRVPTNERDCFSVSLSHSPPSFSPSLSLTLPPRSLSLSLASI